MKLGRLADALLPRAVRERIFWGRARAALERLGMSKEDAMEISKLASGWKTRIGGIGVLAAGIASIASTIASGEFSLHAIQEALTLVGAGLGVLGIGRKMEKQTEATLRAAGLPENAVSQK